MLIWCSGGKAQRYISKQIMKKTFWTNSSEKTASAILGTCPMLLFLEPFATGSLNTCVCQRTAGVGVGQARARTDDGQQRKPWARVGCNFLRWPGQHRDAQKAVCGSESAPALNRTCVTLFTSLTVGVRGEGNSPVTSDTCLLMVDVAWNGNVNQDTSLPFPRCC